MPEDFIRYDVLIENALRGVVFKAMSIVARDGLPGKHHFYITFDTTHPDVSIPDYLRQQYPEEMTIVLQHQFYDLKVDDEGFSVILSFNNVRERLSIPFKAITLFADPAVNFALQFKAEEVVEKKKKKEFVFKDSWDEPHYKEEKKEPEPKKEEGFGKVISLDSFRKKQTSE